MLYRLDVKTLEAPESQLRQYDPTTMSLRTKSVIWTPTVHCEKGTVQRIFPADFCVITPEAKIRKLPLNASIRPRLADARV
jgi:hypothetical protein